MALLLTVTRKVVAGAAGLITVLATAVVFGPLLLRSNAVRYGGVGAIGEGVLTEPIGIAYSDGRLFVSDAAQNRIVVFDTAGAVVATWGDSALGLHRPMHVSLGPGRALYVAEYLSDRITVLDSAGHLVTRLGGTTGSGPGELDAPAGAAELGGAVFTADFYNHRVQVLDGAAPRVIGQPGRIFAGRLHYPTDVAAGDSLIYVADAYNNRVQVFRPTGEHVRHWGGPLGSGMPGPFRGWFRVATGVEVADGRVYVADFYNHRVQVFTDRGRYLGLVADSLSLPTDVAVGENGELYVVDFGHGRVVRFAPRPKQ